MKSGAEKRKLRANQLYPEEEKDKVNQLEWQNNSNFKGPQWGTGILTGHGKSQGFQHLQAQTSDKNS